MSEQKYPYLSDWPEGFMECVDRFLADDAKRSPGMDLYGEVFDTASFYPLQRKRELAEMMSVARLVNPQVVMEIGADKGGSLYHWVKCLPTVKRVIACEIRGCPYKELFERAFPKVQFLWVEGSSLLPDAVATVEKWLGPDKLDCLFIDGDKSYFEVDYDLYSPMVRRPGIVFMHDIRDSPTREAFEKCRAGKVWRAIIDTSESDEAMERERRGEPAGTSYEQWLRFWYGRSCGVGAIFLEKP